MSGVAHAHELRVINVNMSGRVVARAMLSCHVLSRVHSRFLLHARSGEGEEERKLCPSTSHVKWHR